MPNTLTLAEVRALVAQRSGLVGSSYYNSSGGALDAAIKLALERIWRDITSSEVGWGVKDIALTTDTERTSFPVPARHMETLALIRPAQDIQRNGKSRLINRLHWITTWGDDATNSPGLPGVHWYEASVIQIRPAQPPTETMTLFFVEQPPELELDTSQIDLPTGATEAWLELAAANIVQDPAQRNERRQLGERLLSEVVNRVSQQRDRGPDYADLYIESQYNTFNW